MSLSKNIYPSLVLVQPRKTRPFLTERLLMGRKESNQTKKNHTEEKPYDRSVHTGEEPYIYEFIIINLVNKNKPLSNLLVKINHFGLRELLVSKVLLI